MNRINVYSCSLREHPVFSALDSPAEKGEGEKQRQEIRLRFAG